MNKYRKLLGTKRGGHFKEPKKRFRFSTAKRRQSIRWRGRYAKSLMQRIGTSLWVFLKIALIAGTAAWLVSIGIHFFHETQLFQMKSVLFEGRVPDGLPTFLPFKPGQNIFSIKPSDWEKSAQEKFPEIETLSIRRSLTRNVVVDVRLRTPLAFKNENGVTKGVDKDGVVFPLNPTESSNVAIGPFVVAESAKARQTLVTFLSALKSSQPDLYEKVELLSFRDSWLDVSLKGGIVVEWGAFDEKNIFDKAKNILRLLSEFSPTKVPAKLRFVTDDRIVMDANWVAVKTN